MKKTTTYPQYRKYANDKTYFKIISETKWEEITLTGTNYSLHHFTANILPLRNFINDMTFDYERNWLVIEEDEYKRILVKTKK